MPSWIKTLLRYFIRKIKYAPKRLNREIAIVQSSSLGDAALLLPFVSDLVTNRFKITIFCKVGLKEFWQFFLQNIDIKEIDFDKFYKNSSNLYSQKSFEAAFCTSMDKRALYFTSFLKSPKIYSLHEEGNKQFYNKYLSDYFYSSDPDEHVYYRYLTLFTGYFKDEYFRQKNLFSSNHQSNTLLIHPGGKWKPRRWDKNQYLELANSLSFHFKEINILIGSGEEDLHDFFSNVKINDNIHLIVTNNLTQLIENIAKAEFFIGNDSGPAHIANLFKKKMIVLWGPGNFNRVRPIGNNVKIIKKDIECRPCKQYIHPQVCERGSNDCLKWINTEEVINEAKEFLKN